MTVPRFLIVAILAAAIVYLCLQTDQARLKGMPMDTWRLIPLVLTAATFAVLGRRFLNSIAGLFLGGIGGAVGTLDYFAGPYGGIVGLFVGAIVISLPVACKAMPDSKATQIQAKDTGDTAQPRV